MTIFRRIVILLLLVTVFFTFASSVAALDLSEYYEYVPYGSYSFEVIQESGSSEYKSYSLFPLFDSEYTHLLLPVTIRIYDVSYSDNWTDAGNSLFYMGNLNLYDSSFPDTGEPYFFGFEPGVRFACILRGSYPPSSGVPMHLYTGIPPEPSPPASSESIVDSSISDILGYVLGWWSIMWGSLIYGPLSSLLPVLAIAVAVSLIFVVIKLIHKFL